MLWVNFAATPNFSLYPSSGQTLKLYCAYNFNIVLDPIGQNYNSFASVVKFSSWAAAISHIGIAPAFITSASGFVNGNLYKTYGALPLGQKISTSGAVATFGFRTIANITGTTLQFSTNTGWAIVFGPAQTADGITIDATDTVWDMLWSVFDASYSFVPSPCIVDTDAPIFWSVTPGNGAYHVPSSQRFSAIVYDRAGPWIVAGVLPMASNNRSHYRYSGLDVADLANYQAAPSNVDNQEGVNSGSIVLTVSCPLCTSFAGNSYVLSWSDLHLSVRNGTSSINKYTWDSKERWYDMYFDPPVGTSYEIERQVNVTGQAVDNLGNIQTLNMAFNAPSKPTISAVYPSNGAINIDRRNTSMIVLSFADDWAWVDTWSISITIPQILSGADVLMTGYTYSWSDLQFLLNTWSPGLGNAWSYTVQFTWKWNFASNRVITITWFAADLVGNTWTFTLSFTTRPDCGFWWCNTIFQVFGLDAGTFGFTGGLLVITWTDTNTYSPYPYLTWELGDTLMCGLPYSWTILDGNINLYDTSDTLLTHSFYTWTDLYITWLDFTIENGVVVIAP